MTKNRSEATNIKKKIKLDPIEKKELAKHKKLSKKSLSHLRMYEAVEKQVYEPYIISPYNFSFYGISFKQIQIINTAVKKLELSRPNKDKVQLLTRQFYVEFQEKFHSRRNIREHVEEQKALKDLKKNFEIEFDKMITKYKKRYPNVQTTYELAKFQLAVMESFNIQFCPPSLLPFPFPDISVLPEEVIRRHNPSNRPTYKSYDKFLYSLTEVIKAEHHSVIPKIVKYLKSFTAKEFTLFSNFEINNESIRVKISQYRKSINKGVKT